MENSLLEIELVHYVVILMWIPLILQVETTTPAIFKLIIVSFFLLSWLSIELQILFKIEIMFYNFRMICETNCSFAYLWKIIFNFFHCVLIGALACISTNVVMKKMTKKDDTCCEKIQNFLSEILDEIKKTNYNKS